MSIDPRSKKISMYIGGGILGTLLAIFLIL
jgi:hypothetical protein